MYTLTKKAVLAVMALFMLTTSIAGEFELVKRDKNIALYERWVNHNNHTVRELKADFTARAASAEAVIRLLKDPSKGVKWHANAKSYKIAYTQNDAVWLTYVRYHIPWPMNDQDCSLRYSFNKTELNNNSCSVYFEGVQTARFPVLKNVTRITGTNGKWVIEKLREGNLKITYQIVTDKSVSVPRWVSDPIIHENIFNTITAFRKLLEG